MAKMPQICLNGSRRLQHLHIKLSSQIGTESQVLSVKLFVYSCLMCCKFESGQNVGHGVLIPLYCAFQV